MSVAEVKYEPSLAAQVLSPALFSPLLAPSPGWLISINMPAFNASIASKIVRMVNEDDYKSVVVESFIDSGVTALLNLRNHPLNGDSENLEIRHVNLGLDVIEHRPRAVFIAGSLYSMLGLAGPVNISIRAAEVNLGLFFPMELSDISGLLQGRQTSYALMVIEKATGLQFEIPEHETEEDRRAISFAYSAVTDREFAWPTYEITMPMLATDDSLEWIDEPLVVSQFETGIVLSGTRLVRLSVLLVRCGD